MFGLFIVMADSTWLLQDMLLICFLVLVLRCVQVFVTLNLSVVVISTSVYTSFLNINVYNRLCINYGSF
jgi:hypothetical protein